MRVARIFVKDPLSVTDYAYAEEKNEPYRSDMEDSTPHHKQTTSPRIASSPAGPDSSPFLTATAGLKSPSTAPSTFQKYCRF